VQAFGREGTDREGKNDEFIRDVDAKGRKRENILGGKASPVGGGCPGDDTLKDSHKDQTGKIKWEKKKGFPLLLPNLKNRDQGGGWDQKGKNAQ